MSMEASGPRPYPHPHVDEAWLNRLHEDVLEPDLPIVDAHHHLWERPSGRYLLDELSADLCSGHLRRYRRVLRFPPGRQGRRGAGGACCRYVNVGGEWIYLYRAVDRAGNPVDFRLSPRRDVAAARAFFRKAIKGQGSGPRTITLDDYAASHGAASCLFLEKLRQANPATACGT